MKEHRIVALMDQLFKRNNIKITGKGSKWIMFVHGYGCDQSMWRFMLPYFENDFKVILIDLVGSGNSDKTCYDFKKYAHLEMYAEDIIEIIKELNIYPCLFIGHSVSAMIGLLASIIQPELFSAMVMIGPSPCYINVDDYLGGFAKDDIDELMDTLDRNYMGWSAMMAPKIIGDDSKVELIAEMENRFCINQPDIAKHFAKVTFFSDNRKDLHKLNIPSLMIQSAEDFLVPEEVRQYLKSKIVRSKEVLIDTMGHCPHLTAPLPTSSAILEFIHLIGY